MNEEQKDPTIEIINDIRRGLSPAAIFEQLAEECVELAQCALKQARIIRGENPTPADIVDVVKATDEEVADVLNCFTVLGLQPNNSLMTAKLMRWGSRIKAAQLQPMPEIVPEFADETDPDILIEE